MILWIEGGGRFHLEFLEDHGVVARQREGLGSRVVLDLDVDVGVGHRDLLRQLGQGVQADHRVLYS